MGKLQVPGQPWECVCAPACTDVPSCSPGQSTFLAFCRISVISRQRLHHVPDLRIARLLIAHLMSLWESDTAEPDPHLDKCFVTGNSSQGHPMAELVPSSLQVTSKQDRPVSPDLCGELHFSARGFCGKNILCGSTALLPSANASLPPQVL